MNNQQINMAIAESLGWKNVHVNKWLAGEVCYVPATDLLGLSPINSEQGLDPENERLHLVVPDYCNNLNAMHEAELSLQDTEQQMRYASNILEICGQGCLFESGDLNVDHCWIVARVTARVKAEAYLRTIGKRIKP